MLQELWTHARDFSLWGMSRVEEEHLANAARLSALSENVFVKSPYEALIKRSVADGRTM